MWNRLEQLIKAGDKHRLIAPIIGVFDADCTWNVVYYLHAANESMKTLAEDIVAKGGYTEEQLHRKAYASLDALHYLHTNNIAHGNLTHQHFFFSGDEFQLIIPAFLDFHTFRVMHPATPYCKAADILAFGVLIYLLTTGQDPHVLEQDSVALKSLSVPARDVVLECLSNDINQRPTITQLLNRQWFSLQSSSHRYSSRIAIKQSSSLSSASSFDEKKETFVDLSKFKRKFSKKASQEYSLIGTPGKLASTPVETTETREETVHVYTAVGPYYAYQPFPYSTTHLGANTARLSSTIRGKDTVVRSLQLPVHFSAFGPPSWNLISRKCRVFIWACAPHQFEDMLEMALQQGVVETGRLSRGLRLMHGTMVTISIEPCAGLVVVGESSKSFQWMEEMTKVFFDLKVGSNDLEDIGRLCRAKIIVGTHVAILHFTLPSVLAAFCEEEFVVNYPSTYTPLEPPSLTEISIPSNELTLLETIGSGSFGTAYRAIYNNNSVVVKTLQTDTMARSHVSEQEFMHEITALSMLGKHPHVVKFIGACPENKSIVMEYVPNGSVEKLIYDARDDYEFYGIYARTIFARDAAHGIVNIHQGSFLHRDIAARNCLLDQDFHVKVCDFGLSRPVDRMGHVLDQPGFGPLKWMAPESLELPHVYSPASDTYMFGVLLYEIMMGDEPFGSHIRPQDAAALVLEGHRLTSDVSASCPTEHLMLMEACLRTDPQRRPSMLDISATLDEWLRAHAMIEENEKSFI
ncbi:kinase [Thraustotheca clavata]|uniref:Kinase n=1 Tax=Thraustotheca clavata TaxID=74557 RepID=A0A1V9Z0Z8_9STRA|nr:kinase [Thraustotheca clavata]